MLEQQFAPRQIRCCHLPVLRMTEMVLIIFSLPLLQYVLQLLVHELRRHSCPKSTPDP